MIYRNKIFIPYLSDYKIFIYVLTFLFIHTLLFRSTTAQDDVAPKSVKELLKKGDARMEVLDHEKAVKHYTKAFGKWDEDVTLMLKIAQCYTRLNETGEAEKWYSKAFETEHQLDPLYYLQYGEVLVKNEKYYEARDWFTKYNQLIEDEDLRASEYIRSIEDLNQYYTDSSFFRIEDAGINSVQSDMNPFVTGNSLFFVSSRDQKKSEKTFTGYDIYYTEYNEQGTLSEPEILADKRVNSVDNEGQIYFAQETKKLFFTRTDKKLNKLSESERDYTNMQVFEVETGDSVFHILDIEPFIFENFAYSIGQPTLNDYQNKMVFVSEDVSGEGGTDLFLSYFINGAWSFPLNVGNQINTPGDEVFPYLYNDSILYFASNGHGGLGGLDMFKVNLNVRPYKVSNLGYPFNTSKDDFGIVLDKEGMSGYFSSNREGGKGNDDIYRFEVVKFRINGIFIDQETGDNLQHLHLDIILNDTLEFDLTLADNGYFEMDAQPGEFYEVEVSRENYLSRKFTVSTNHISSFDLQNINLGEISLEKIEPGLITSKSNEVIDIKIDSSIHEMIETTEGDISKVYEEYFVEEIVDADNFIEEEIDQEIKVSEIASSVTVFRVQIAASRVPLGDSKLKKIYQGNRDIFMFTEEGWYKYAIGEFESYFEANKLRKMCGVDKAFIAAYKKDKKLILMNAIKEKYAHEKQEFEGEKIAQETDHQEIVDHKTIYFGFDNYSVPASEYSKLDEIVMRLRNDGNLMLEIDAHADIQGSFVYNEGLSVERAKETYNYFIHKGVDKNRIIVRSYGESNVAKQCYQNCTASIHMLNRRAELILYTGDLNQRLR